MSENNYTVYAHISPENKIYFGITCKKNLNKRWNNGNGYRHNEHFTNSINLYGWDIFKHEIIYDKLTKKEACEAEIRLIEKFDTCDRKYGYNILHGGDTGRNGIPWSDEQKKKLSESHIGIQAKENHPLWGKKLSEEHRNKISQTNSDGRRKGKNHNNWGKKASVETKQKLYKPVICITTGVIYPSGIEAERQTGISRSNVCSCCKGRRNFAGKHLVTGKLLQWQYYEDYLKETEVV